MNDRVAHSPCNNNQGLPISSRRQFVASIPICSLAIFGKANGLQTQDLSIDDDIALNLQSLMTSECNSAIKKGLEFLKKRQNEDGSFGSGIYSRNVAVVSLVAIAMLCSGSTPGRGDLGAVIKKAVDFVVNKANESGFINVQKSQSHGPMYGHGFATLLLAIVHGCPEVDVKKQLTDAVKVILQSQNEEGGWRYQPRRKEADISVTVCQVMALRAAKKCWNICTLQCGRQERSIY